jgi:hypothetical protein
MTLGVVGFWTAVGAVVMGLIIADIWTNPTGTKAAGDTIVNLEKNTGNQLIGKAA